MASNQVEVRNKARDAVKSAEDSGVKGGDLDRLKATLQARQDDLKDATGSSGNWGILS